jgi:hypothetical protein
MIRGPFIIHNFFNFEKLIWMQVFGALSRTSGYSSGFGRDVRKHGFQPVLMSSYSTF